ncbi:hypothetical protein P280DRAFT_486736 [Massarina eburnea CBS 473.64]|uniref:Mid2 domain-containing protein n=1 Tax=Massarina eburnea CBS 473.64 TaxID=1395130 RepID=A0A6A6SCM1_9PLEO|nr:hypothetical protein P280DRAFT_486736 [Massarina eburnea CBS 473.64]
MWFLRAPAAVLGLVCVALLPSVAAKPYPHPIHMEEARQLHNTSQLERRIECAANQTPCGENGGYTCCNSGETCGSNSLNQAVCNSGGDSGQWSFTTIITTGVVTRTTVLSSLIGGVATPQPTAACGSSQSSCGSVCCDSGYWCPSLGVCKLAGGPTPGLSGTINPSAPLRPTSSTLIVITATGSPTATVPFSTPIATGASGGAVETQAGGGGLSGGAIAGIVIGVLAGIALLLLLCFYCCAKSVFDSLLALIGLGGKKRRRHEESTYVEEHHRHGSSAAAGGAAGGRRWYGQGSSGPGPSRPSRPPMKEKTSGGGGGMLGIGAGLAGLAAVLGMRRKHDQRHDDKSTTVSGYSYYTSDYTSTSSASSDDRRTRHTRQTGHSSRR